MTRAWIVVASAEHVARGRTMGIVQACHGKAAPLRRMAAGDTVLCYSPTVSFRGKDRLQAFTAIGTVRAGAPYRAEMGVGFCPWRRDVDWRPSTDAPIRPLLDRLEFTRGRSNWGYRFRFGLFEIASGDAEIVASAMRLPEGGMAGYDGGSTPPTGSSACRPSKTPAPPG